MLPSLNFILQINFKDVRLLNSFAACNTVLDVILTAIISVSSTPGCLHCVLSTQLCGAVLTGILAFVTRLVSSERQKPLSSAC